MITVSNHPPKYPANRPEPTPTTTENKTAENTVAKKNETHEDQQKKVLDRMSRLREFSMKLRGGTGVADLETEPAYKRRNVPLNDVIPSSESEVSKYTLAEETGPDGEKRVEIKSNNSFLHGNVD